MFFSFDFYHLQNCHHWNQTSIIITKDVVNGPRWPNYQMGSQRKVSLYSKLGWKPAALLLCNLDLCKIGQIQNAKSDAGRLPPYTDPQYHCPLIFTLCQTDGLRASMEQLCPSSLTSFFAICRGVRLLFFCQKYLHVCILNSKITLALKVHAQKKTNEFTLCHHSFRTLAF